jgi:hypothetical protein
VAVPVSAVTACQLCGSGNLSLLLDMGDQPLSERHDDPRTFPLRLIECGRCTLVQLDHIVDQCEVFPPDHPYATGNTKFLRDHFAALAQQLGELLDPGDLVIDIAANDGTLLHACRQDVRRVGVEPTDQALKARRDCQVACDADCEIAPVHCWNAHRPNHKPDWHDASECDSTAISVYQEFFTAALAEKMLAEHGQARVITATNVFAHVPDAHDFLEGVRLLLADDGTFVVETHDVASITGGLQIDTIYHEHLRYYSVATLSRLLAMHGLTVTQAEPIATHGGSFRAYARKTRTDLGSRAKTALSDLSGLLADITADGALVYGIGATTRATPLIHAAGIARYITRVCEVSSSAKIGLMMPGTSIPIVDEVALIEDRPQYALLFSWHIAASIIPSLRAMGYGGRFIVPLPEPRILDA